jgi:GTP-binding protein
MMPSRGLIGFRGLFLTLTSGSGILTSVFDHYGPVKDGEVQSRKNGVLVSMLTGKTAAYSLFNLQSRGRMFLGHAIEVYEGQIIGIHSRDNDLAVNPVKGKQLTNVRASGTDEALTLTPPIRQTLEQALEFIEDDELVEVTPLSIRVRKKFLTENERKRNGRK